VPLVTQPIASGSPGRESYDNMRMCAPDPIFELVLRITMRHQQRRILKNLRHRPPKKLKQLRFKPLRLHPQSFQQHELRISLSAGGEGQGEGELKPLHSSTAPPTAQHLATRQLNSPLAIAQLPAQPPIRLRHRRRTSRMKTKNRWCPVHVHPAILLPIPARMHPFTRTFTKPRHLALPIHRPNNSLRSLPRVDHVCSSLRSLRSLWLSHLPD
jgi:hypothetical protein